MKNIIATAALGITLSIGSTSIFQEQASAQYFNPAENPTGERRFFDPAPEEEPKLLIVPSVHQVDAVAPQQETPEMLEWKRQLLIEQQKKEIWEKQSQDAAMARQETEEGRRNRPTFGRFLLDVGMALAGVSPSSSGGSCYVSSHTRRGSYVRGYYRRCR